MALTFILPRDLDAAPSVGTSDVIPVDTGSDVVKATAAQIVDAGRPVASEAQAIAGTDNSTGMTPLTTRQAMEAFFSASSGFIGGRADFVSLNAAASFSDIADGASVTVDGLAYVRKVGATAIPDLPGWVPGGRVYPEHFATDLSADAGAAIRAAIAYLAAAGGGDLHLRGVSYALNSTETKSCYEVDGAGVSSMSNVIGCVWLKSGVNLIGVRGKTVLRRTGGGIGVILGLLDYFGVITGVEVYGAGESTNAQHGICTYTETAAFVQTSNVHITGCHVHHVGSYGIGFQCGWQTNCSIRDTLIEYTGADGVDWKARGVSHDAAYNSSWGNVIDGVTVRHSAQRDAVVDNSSAFGLRGAIAVSNIQALGVRDTASGITLDPGISNGADIREPAHKLTLTNFRVEAAARNANVVGLEVWENGPCAICNGVVVGAQVSFPVVTSTPFPEIDGASLSNVTVIGPRGLNAFYIAHERVHLHGCRALSEKQYFSTKRGNLSVGQTEIVVADGTAVAGAGVSLAVLKNRLPLTLTTDYTVSATGITLVTPAASGDEFVVIFPPVRAVRIEASYCSVIGGGADKWVPNGVSYSSDSYRDSGVSLGFLYEDKPGITQVSSTTIAVIGATGSTDVSLQIQGKNSSAGTIINRPSLINVPNTATGLPTDKVWSNSGDLQKV